MVAGANCIHLIGYESVVTHDAYNLPYCAFIEQYIALYWKSGQQSIFFADEFLFICQGMCVWKAKNTSIGSSTSTAVVETQSAKPGTDAHPPDAGPGKSFRNFRFDTAGILRAMEAGFSA